MSHRIGSAAICILSTVMVGLVSTMIITSPVAAATPSSMFGTMAPAVPADVDPDAVELGIQFKSSVPGVVLGVRFYKGSGNTGTHVGSLWSGSTKVATATFTSESVGGWQQVTFAKPAAVRAGRIYTASYFAPHGHYAVNNPFSFPRTSGALTAIKGTYRYGGGYPSYVYEKSNYWVDVLFTPTAPTTTTAPASTTTASSATTGMVTTSSVTSNTTTQPTSATTASTDPTMSTTTTTTSSPSGSCSGTVNTPGGADPWGTCWPGPNNTGVRAGTTLTTYTGPTTITTAGTVIDSKLITGCLNIKANNVVIKNSRVQSKGCFFNILSDNRNTGLQLTDVEIDGQGNTSGDSAINGGGFACLRCNLHGTIDGAKAQSNVVFQDSYIHDLVNIAGSHNDGIQSLGTTGLTISHNTIIVKGAATSAVILSTGSASDMRNVAIKRNLLAGGAYTVYGGYQAGTDSLSKVSDISITDNRFSTVIYPRSGAYGPLTSVDAPVIHTGNTWADGTNAGKGID